MTHLQTILMATVVGVSLTRPALADERRESWNAPEEAAPSDGGPPLLLGRSIEIGGYAGVDVAYSRMFGEDGALVGVHGALLLDHRLSIGLAGYGWTHTQPGPSDELGNERHFEVGYGGATIRYSIYTDRLPVYFSVGALVGGGAIALVNEGDEELDGFSDDADDQDVFAVLQPDVALHANLTPWLRLGLTAGYRFTNGVDRHGRDDGDLNGLVLGGQVQVGRF